jgi:hypothetical protein
MEGIIYIFEEYGVYLCEDKGKMYALVQLDGDDVQEYNVDISVRQRGSWKATFDRLIESEMLDLDFNGNLCIIKEKQQTPQRQVVAAQPAMNWSVPLGRSLQMEYTDEGITRLKVEDQKVALASLTSQVEGDIRVMRRTQEASIAQREMELKEGLESSNVQHQLAIVKGDTALKTALARKREETDRQMVASDTSVAIFEEERKKEVNAGARKLQELKANLSTTNAREVESQETALAVKTESLRARQQTAADKWSHDEAEMTATRDTFLKLRDLKQAETMGVIVQTADTAEQQAKLACDDAMSASKRQSKHKIKLQQLKAQASAAASSRRLEALDAEREGLENETELMRQASEVSARSRIDEIRRQAADTDRQNTRDHIDTLAYVRAQCEENRTASAQEHTQAMDKARNIIR